jgi:AraC-like DNA-binding protein
MQTLLNLDFRAIQSELLKRDFIHSSELLPVASQVFKAKEHGYRRIDDHSFLHVLNFEALRPYSLALVRPDLICIQIVIRGSYLRRALDRIDIVDSMAVEISNLPRSTSDAKLGAKLRGLLIVCERQHFVEMFKLDVDRLPQAYRPIFVSQQGSVEPMRLPLSPSLAAATDQVLAYPYPEPLRTIHARAKAMEIICEVAARISMMPARPTSTPPARHREQAVEIAAAIYRRELDKPPSIDQLAARVGLNRNELTSGFRALFGSTPRAYGHMIRMEHAQELLCCGSFSISEVARRVGYEGYSSFSRAFLAYFDRPPASGLPGLAHTSRPNDVV